MIIRFGDTNRILGNSDNPTKIAATANGQQLKWKITVLTSEKELEIFTISLFLHKGHTSSTRIWILHLFCWFWSTYHIFYLNYLNSISLAKEFLIMTTVQLTSFLTKASVWYKIRVFWADINHVKSHAMALAFSLQTSMSQIFKMRYCTLL